MRSAGTGERRARARRGRIEAPVDRGAELPSDRARLPRTNRTTVELHDRRHVARRSRHEQLVETADLLLENGRLAYVDAFLDRELEHDVTRDARKDVVGAWVRAQLAIDDAKHVRMGSLGDDAVTDEHGLERAGGDGVLLGKDRA